VPLPPAAQQYVRLTALRDPEPHHLRTSKRVMRLRCGGLLLVPLTAVEVAPFVESSHRGMQRSAWSPLANVLFVVGALFLFAAPFIVEFLLRTSRKRLEEALGTDLDQLLLLMGVGGSASVSMMPLIFTALVGSSIVYNPYPWAAVSFLWAGFWCWRFWHVLR